MGDPAPAPGTGDEPVDPMDLDTRPLTVGEWMITILVLAIPLVNIIMYLYWALSEGGNLNRKRFCQASLLWFLIVVGIGTLFAVLAAFLGLML